MDGVPIGVKDSLGFIRVKVRKIRQETCEIDPRADVLTYST